MNKKKKITPPKTAEKIIRLLATSENKNYILGDLEEDFKKIAKKRGILRARLWYWFQCLYPLPAFIKNYIFWSFVMFRNYMKIAVRNIVRHKGYSFINIIGLAFGMACSIFILLWVRDELNFDRFHENIDNIYRVVCEEHLKNKVDVFAITSSPFVSYLKNEYPEIAKAAMVNSFRKSLIKNGEKSYYEDDYCLADPDFLEIFSFPLVKGDPAKALSDPYSVIITEEMATKYFGTDDPMGKSLNIDNRFDVIVTGVLKNIPDNSSLDFGFLSPFELEMKEFRSEGTAENWGYFAFSTYVSLSENSSLSEVNSKIYDFLLNNEAQTDFKTYLQPMEEMHLYSSDIAGRINSKGNIKYVYMFSSLAILVLIIACINFMNLMTARSGNRAKEVGMRKVAGAKRADLIKQFFGESVLMSYISLLIAVFLVALLLPSFNTLTGKNLPFSLLMDAAILSSFAGIALLAGIISGTYPALFISAFQPVRILKGVSGSNSKSLGLRKLLVVVQFAISTALIISVLILLKQLNYIKNKDLGYDREHVVSALMPNNEVRGKYNLLKTELLNIPNVINVTGSNSKILIKGASTSDTDWDGKEEDDRMLTTIDFVDYSYIETLDIKLAGGRNFSEEYATDDSATYIVNEEAVRRMGLENPVGSRLALWQNNGEIIGVMKDFNYKSLYTKIEPLVFMLDNSNLRYIHIKLRPDNISETLSAVENRWNLINPGYPFDFKFLDEEYDLNYRTEQRVSAIFKYFTFFGIFISCLGLIGLASFTAEKRTKEIGVRKVLGASERGLVFLLTKEFIKWVVTANLIAWPAAYYVMNIWLGYFAYRTDISLSLFIFSGVASILIAVFTVSLQAIRAARANPVKSLRYE